MINLFLNNTKAVKCKEETNYIAIKHDNINIYIEPIHAEELYFELGKVLNKNDFEEQIDELRHELSDKEEEIEELKDTIKEIREIAESKGVTL